MDDQSSALLQHFSALSDPRIERAKRHKLIDLVVIAICAVICDADGWEDIETFALARAEWLSTFLELPNGIPSHDTFRRVFARLDTKAFQRCFLGWMRAVNEVTSGDFVAIDGKTLRRSFDRAKGVAPLHIVSAWSRENRMTLGQVRVEDGSNEIPAINALLSLLDLKGCIVTIDAIGCQRETADKITGQGADYVLALKKNQPGLYDDVALAFDGADVVSLTARLGAPVMTTDGDHGRIEERRYWLTNDINWLAGKERWSGLRGIGIAERASEAGGERSIERRYFIVSFAKDTERFATSVRGHWAIESTLHWCLDVTFREDSSRIRHGNAPENFAMLRRAAVSLLTRMQGKKMTVAKMRYRAALDERYLTQILRSNFEEPLPAPEPAAGSGA